MKKSSMTLIPLLFLLVPFLTAKAFELKTGNTVFLAENEELSGNVYAAGNLITVKSPVEGDLFCAGQSVTIDADVAGDVFCAAQSITVNGKVGGSVRALGNTVAVNGQVARNVQILGAALSLGPEAEVGWEMFAAGAFIDIRGKIGRTLHGGAQSVNIAGEVGGDVKLRLDQSARPEKSGWQGESGLTVADSAKINGNLYYTAKDRGKISSQAEIKGEVGYSEPKIKKFGRDSFVRAAGSWLFKLFTSLVIGLVLVSLWRDSMISLTDKMLAKPWPTIGWGASVLFLGPFILFILALTLIGLPLSVILLALWLIALYVAKIITGVMFGRKLMERFFNAKKNSLIWAMILGVAAASFFSALPIIGWFLALVIMLWGLGGIWLFIKENKINYT